MTFADPSRTEQGSEKVNPVLSAESLLELLHITIAINYTAK